MAAAAFLRRLGAGDLDLGFFSADLAAVARGLGDFLALPLLAEAVARGLEEERGREVERVRERVGEGDAAAVARGVRVRERERDRVEVGERSGITITGMIE